MSAPDTEIDKSASVDPAAKLGSGVHVGAFAVIGPDVELGDGVIVGPHAVVMGHTTVGARSRISPFACVGGAGQIKGLIEEPGRLVIGCDNVIREQVTINAGSTKGGGSTRIGDDNLLMIGAHVGHDSRVGSNCIIGNMVALAGHVEVEDHAILSAYTGVHQNCRIGESVMAAANAKIAKDAVPFSLVAHDRARLVGLNVIGLRRRGFPAAAIGDLKHAFHVLFHSRLRFQHALERVRAELGDRPEVVRLLRFLEASKRGICR